MVDWQIFIRCGLILGIFEIKSAPQNLWVSLLIEARGKWPKHMDVWWASSCRLQQVHWKSTHSSSSSSSFHKNAWEMMLDDAHNPQCDSFERVATAAPLLCNFFSHHLWHPQPPLSLLFVSLEREIDPSVRLSVRPMDEGVENQSPYKSMARDYLWLHFSLPPSLSAWCLNEKPSLSFHLRLSDKILSSSSFDMMNKLENITHEWADLKRAHEQSWIWKERKSGNSWLSANPVPSISLLGPILNDWPWNINFDRQVDIFHCKLSISVTLPMQLGGHRLHIRYMCEQIELLTNHPNGHPLKWLSLIDELWKCDQSEGERSIDLGQ